MTSKFVKTSVIEMIREREIESVYHFTNVGNLQSIIKYGLVPRSELERKSIPFICSDRNRLDGRKDTVSLSVSYPNGRMLYAKAFNASYAVIELKPEVLSYNCLFFSCNAACYNAYAGFGPQGFADMFGGNDGKFPRDEQAEVMCREKIPVCMIKRIIFKSESDRMKCNYSGPVPFVVDPKYFSVRDYAFRNYQIAC